MKLLRLFLSSALLLLFSISSFAYCRAIILCKTNKGKLLEQIYLRTYRHGFLYTKCSLTPKYKNYLTDKVLQKQLCEQKIAYCDKHKTCKTQLIFRQGWPFFGHH